jgi:hypothetical protein
MSVAELTHEQFTSERFEPLVEQALNEAGICLNAAHFFHNWKLWMELGFARAWGDENCLIGVIVTPDVFSGELRAQVVFWFSRPEVRHGSVTGAVFRTAEHALWQAGCRDIQAASHEKLTPALREAGHLKNGFRKTETIFTKDLS